MLLKDFPPSIELLDFIQCYRIVDFEFSLTDNIPVKAYPPKPENCLHFFLKDRFALGKLPGEKEYQPPILFSGQQTSLITNYTDRNFLDIQIVFQPTAIFRLLGIPSFELANRFVDASFIFPSYIQNTLDLLQNEKNYSQLLNIVELFVKKLVASAKKDFSHVDAISSQMISRISNISLDTQAKAAFLSSKQFKRIFFERTGVNPKTYTRIVRFNKVFNLKNRHPNKPWASIASTYGYLDYQHLAKDYKEFTGMSPHQFHLVETNAPENILGLAKTLYLNRAANGWQ